ncbi:transporter [Rhodoferax sp. TH121]|uniref:DMT family transporter n=1 Tax=Rhodoferax sp. TH121 TaxID=2022803 RepID=UPI000B968363|nr:DMT family transporter [Rhodoferax sp. TH121]OYQ39995.1 transporter [Rhodoferax sp. TH121]
MLVGILAGLAAGALWGLVFVAPALAPGLTSVDLAAGRFASYGLTALLVMLLARGKRRWPTPSQWGAALGLSVLGFSGYYLLLVLSIRDAGIEVPTLIIGTIPIWVMLLGKPEHLRWRSLLPGLLLTVLGVLLMMGAETAGAAELAAQGWVYWRGIGFALLSMVCWTAFAVLNSAWLKHHHDVNVTDWTNWLGVASGLGAIGLWLMLGSESKALLAQADIAQAAMVCIATGVGSAWLATVLWNMASRRLSASLCGQLIVSETLFALLYAFVGYGVWPHWLQWLASATFVMGIIATVRAHK